MKLEPNMYVRTRSGRIYKATKTNIVGKYYYLDIQKEREILKASHNIIDLIEVGDYVNGRKVIKNCLEDGGNIILFENGFCATNKDIKSIVTKEQFSSMEYKVNG